MPRAIKSGNNSVAIIMYYDWYSDGRAKASRDVYSELGYQMLVFCTRERNYPKKRTEDGVRIWNGIAKYMGNNLFLYLLSHLIFVLQASFWLFCQCLFRKPCLIHIHNMPDYLMGAAFIGKLFGIRTLWDVRDIAPAVWFSKKHPNSLKPFGRLYEMMLSVQILASRISDHIICADKLQKGLFLKNGVNPQKIDVFMNLPLEQYFWWIGTPKKSNHFGLVYHGTLTHRLGLDQVIRAINIVSRNIDVRLDIIGDGDTKYELRDLINSLKLNNIINISGKFIRTEDLPQWIKGASGAIIPNRKTYSTDNFMLPHKMLEYIKLGIPVIVPRLHIIESYLSGDEAIFYEPEDIQGMAKAIERLWCSDRDAIAKKAYQLFDRHGYEQNKEVLRIILKKIKKINMSPSSLFI